MIISSSKTYSQLRDILLDMSAPIYVYKTKTQGEFVVRVRKNFTEDEALKFLAANAEVFLSRTKG